MRTHGYKVSPFVAITIRRTLDEHSLALRIASPEKVELELASQGKVLRLPVVQQDSLRPNTPYRFELTYNPLKNQIQANLMTQS